MILKEVTFQNFKSYKYQKVTINNINIVIGKNNSGKSNLLEGLDLFFNYYKKHREDNLDDFLYKNNLDKSSKIKFSIDCIFLTENEALDITPSRKNVDLLPVNQKNELRVKFVYDKSKGFSKYEIYNNNSNNFISLSPTQFRKLFTNLEFLYIPAFRDFNNTKILEDIFGKLLNKTSSLRNNRIIKSLNVLKSRIDKNIIEDFKRDFNNLIDHDFFGHLSFDLKFGIDDRELVRDFLKTCTPFLTDGVQTEVKEKGSGMQSFVIIWLYNYLTKLSNKNLILAIEEPESHLHPSAQKNLIKGISKIFKSQNNQIILSTHSPFLVNGTKLEDVLYVRSVKSKNEIFSELKQIKGNSLNSGDINFFERNFSAERKDIFFEDVVVLVEDIPDKLVFEHLLKLYNFDSCLENCSFIPVGGTAKFKYIVKLLILFKIPFVIVFDRDFIYQKDKFGNEHFGFINMCSYAGVNISSSQVTDLKNEKNNITKLNKILFSLNAISLTIDLEKDLMTDKTLPIFKKVLQDNAITLEKIKNENYKKSLIKGNIQNISYEIKNNKDLPRYYQTLLSAILRKIKEIKK